VNESESESLKRKISIKYSCQPESNVLDNVTKWLYVARSAKISTSKSYAVIAVMVNPDGANARLRDGNWKRNPFVADLDRSQV
jgi:hypothetical protein